jgi:hypothetical protein
MVPQQNSVVNTAEKRFQETFASTSPTERLMQNLANRNIQSQLSSQIDGDAASKGFVLKYTEPKLYPITEHLEKLSLPKP